MRLAPAVLLGLALTSCASTMPAPLPELTMLSVEPVDYDYKLGGEVPEFDFEFDTATSEDERNGRPLVDIQAKIFLVDREASNALDPERPLAGAFTTTLADAERFAEEAKSSDQVTLVNAQRLNCFENQRGYVSVLHQTAYVSSFEFEQGKNAYVADPIVEVLQDGIVLQIVAPSVTAESVQVQTSLMVCNAVKPIAEVELTPVKNVQPITIQQPVLATQKLEFDVELAADEALVLKCEDSTDESTRLLIFLCARPMGDE